MIKIENVEVVGWEHAIRGMRNPKNSWDRSDSGCCADFKCTDCPLYDIENSCCDHEGDYILGPNDLGLANRLDNGGPVHAKYRRMIVVYLDIVAPLYWWKEFDTYKVGTVANSCSTMHKIQDKEFTLENFSCEHLMEGDGFHIFDKNERDTGMTMNSKELLQLTINYLNSYREAFIATKNKDLWWQMIQLLPSSYNQRRTVMLNYEVLVGIYKWRKNHKLDEWREFCEWIESLPYSELITGRCELKEVEKKEETDELTCDGCKWVGSAYTIDYMKHCIHCKRAYKQKVDQDIHEDRYEAKEES